MTVTSVAHAVRATNFTSEAGKQKRRLSLTLSQKMLAIESHEDCEAPWYYTWVSVKSDT
jgi:hypothetical protein